MQHPPYGLQKTKITNGTPKSIWGQDNAFNDIQAAEHTPFRHYPWATCLALQAQLEGLALLLRLLFALHKDTKVFTNVSRALQGS